VNAPQDGHTARTTDPDGREVVLDAKTRLHLVEGRRGWLLAHVDLILGTVSLPDHHEDDPLPGRERFYRQNPLDPRRWLRVVVDFNEVPGWIVTVLVQDNDPRGTQR
jgi:hypothetical protein